MVDAGKHRQEMPLAAMALMKLLASLAAQAAAERRRQESDAACTVVATYEDSDGRSGQVLCEVSALRGDAMERGLGEGWKGVWA